MNGIWPFSGHTENDLSILFWNIPWKAAKKKNDGNSVENKRILFKFHSHISLFIFFRCFIFNFLFLQNFSLSKKWTENMCSSNQILNTAPGMLIRISQDNEALNSRKETLVVLGNTFNSWKKLQLSQSLPASAPAHCLQVQLCHPFARLPPQDHHCQVLSCSCKTSGSTPPTLPASPPPTRRAKW